MTMEEAQEILQEIKHYLTAGNPVWDVDEIAEALDMAIEALRNEINCVKCVHYTERETYTGIKGVCKMDTAHREDIISRSRAIKEISEWATDILHPKNLIKEDAIGILESLPSVELATNLQPSCNQLATDLISRSDAIDAWWHDEVFFGNQRDDMTKEQWLDYITDVIESLPSADPKTWWIPVSEALPSKGQVVLAIGDKGIWDVGKFQGTAGWTDDERMWNWKKKTVKYVEYWMPKDAIPLPNREDGEA